MTNINFEAFKDRDFKEDSTPLNNYRGDVALLPGDSVLDIGGADGSYLDLIYQKLKIKGAVLDPDKDSLKYGAEKHPHIEFIHGTFPHVDTVRKFDMVSMLALFPHIGDWKNSILTLANMAKQYVNFTALLSVSSKTMDDIDTSYFYYLDTGERVHQVICNLYEIINFMCLEEVRAKKIQFWGHNTVTFGDIPYDMEKEMVDSGLLLEDFTIGFNDHSHVFRGLPGFKTYHGHFLLQLFSEEDNPKRMGGLGRRGKDFLGYEFFKPEIEIILNDKPYLHVKDGLIKISAAAIFGNSQALRIRKNGL